MRLVAHCTRGFSTAAVDAEIVRHWIIFSTEPLSGWLASSRGLQSLTPGTT
jgi:hypothetical protein